MERYAQAMALLTAAIVLMQEADDTLVVALLSEPLDLIAARVGTTTLHAS